MNNEKNSNKKRIILLLILLLILGGCGTYIYNSTKTPDKDTSIVDKNEPVSGNEDKLVVDEENDSNEVKDDKPSTPDKGNDGNKGDNEKPSKPSTPDKPQTPDKGNDDKDKPSKPQTPEKPQEPQKPTTPDKPKPQPKPDPKPDPKPEEPSKPAHEHKWVAQYETQKIEHKEEGHYEKVKVKDAWDEDIYEERMVTYCNACGQIFGGGTEPAWSQKDMISHVKKHALNGETGGHTTALRKIKVGTKHHEAVYENRWVVDKKAWTEEKKVLVGYKCECGKTK